VKRLLLIPLLLVCARLAAAQTYKIDPEHSTIAFSVRHLLGTARGEFRQFGGTITIDRERPERSSASATIQVASIDTKIRRRDEHLLSAEFFDAKQFPTITFRSRSVSRTAPDRGDITGELTMKGVTRPITLHVKLLTAIGADEAPPRTSWSVTSDAIRRVDFNLMFSSTAEAISGISQQVIPAITIEAVRAAQSSTFDSSQRHALQEVALAEEEN
jgi:polyisoprenoid-binding protein YceI